ncbi:UDP-3-O-[3-hydroxymyristoyl] N-acetylglucosamine deacetylase [Chelatococcus caeni]|uniref:UDP-3-O-acyl-N-acetylglucosamine deacetylase n=1 Tax=Chelatococcus caeni TaxID=1348468 RepID=A0A840C4R7_9HYPH|nr:UDP-3-O-acyl-N-acetylglucosamine deacetylase [Chelatococcus caeni]MBB4017926.1 UDP-3-O-[3-hydroxymyristoyl] N-acetylglucosamine deacetylase [Chelatococcus caeni]
MKANGQTTLRDTVTLTGNGVHSGKPVRLTVHPADVNHGIVFLRTGLTNGRERLIEARHIAVSATELCTVIGESDSGAVATIEHLMSALAGLGIDNALIEVDGPEIPILDGSAALFVEAFDRVGLASQSAARRYVKVLRSVRVQQGKAFAELKPRDKGFRLDVEIDFDTPLIGRQRKIVDLSATVYRREIANARTFGFMRDVERLWKAGFALGASLDNTVALGEDRILNEEGLRHPDEFVRHKLLDAIGDLALSGLPLIGNYHSYCGGHRLNFMVLDALFSDRANYAIVEGEPRREQGHAEIAGGIAVPAYAPDIH